MFLELYQKTIDDRIESKFININLIDEIIIRRVQDTIIKIIIIIYKDSHKPGYMNEFQKERDPAEFELIKSQLFKFKDMGVII